MSQGKRGVALGKGFLVHTASSAEIITERPKSNCETALSSSKPPVKPDFGKRELEGSHPTCMKGHGAPSGSSGKNISPGKVPFAIKTPD